MGGGKGGGTIGYHYLCSLLFGIGRGPANATTHIKVGGKLAWKGSLTDDQPATINRPDLFGGQEKEGGIQGMFRSLMGGASQIIPGAAALDLGKGPYRKATLPFLRESLSYSDPDQVSEFRGRHVIWYDGLVSSMNPYIKEWEFRRWRTTAGWHNDDPWYPDKATIYLRGEGNERIYAMNPAHIVYQAATDPSLGRGQSPDELDEDSFILAANAFCTEQFGLCFHWQREDEIGNFIQSVCDHAGMVMYTDRETGLINVKLIRNDYLTNDLPLFEKGSGLISIDEDDSGSSDQVVDEVIINGKSPVTNQKIQGRAHNLAVRHFRGGATTRTVEYPGLPTVNLCNRIAERDRDMAGAGLRKFKVKLDRAGFRIHPGAVFRVSYPPKGLNNIVLRAGEIDEGNMLNNEITISCVQDVFSLPDVSFVAPIENTWEPPNQEAVPATAEVIEASYRDLYRRLSQADLDTMTEDTAQIAVLAERPTVTAQNYDLIDRAEGETDWPAIPTTNFFTASAKLVADITATETEFVIENPIEFPEDESTLVGLGLYIGDEYMRIESYDPETLTFSVARGAVDTWPKPHTLGDIVWLIDDDVGVEEREYLPGETVEAKVLPRTSSDVLSENEAPIITVDLVGRPFRPYPPAAVKVDGTSIYEPISEVPVNEPELSWAERNRLTQADVLVSFEEATVTAEAGTTYRVEIYNTDDDLIGTHDGIVASPWTYDAALQGADGIGFGPWLYARIYSVRDGVDSLEQQRFVLRIGDVLMSDGDVLLADGDFITA